MRHFCIQQLLRDPQEGDSRHPGSNWLPAVLLGVCFLLLTTTAHAAVDDWAIQATPNPEGAEESKLKGVSCVTPTDCKAVGHYKKPFSVKSTLAEYWDGSTWKIQSIPNPKGSSEASLQAVSCTSLTSCMAIGYYKVSGFTVPLAELWNGKEWEIKLPPSPGLNASLQSVSCTSSTFCMAVGSYVNGSGVTVPFSESWNGEKWEIKPTPTPEKSIETSLRGVSCTSSSACTATGFYRLAASPWKTLAERWDGKEWTIQSTPNPESKSFERASLEGVSCVTSTICTAVGYSTTGGASTTLAERWDGKEWTIQSTPNPEESEEPMLNGVSCATEAICIATGTYKQEFSVLKPFGERLESEKWQVHFPLNPGVPITEHPLVGISCASSTKCMAVGHSQDFSEAPITLAESYVRAEPPENSTPPSVSPPAPKTGAFQSTTTGTWIKEPISYAYQWQRCNASGLECADILGAIKSTYSPLTDDVGHTLVAKVTASNAAGSASAFSKATEEVKKVGVVDEYPLPAGSAPIGITAGPDEKLWFANNSSNKIGKITTSGTVTEYSTTPFEGSGPMSIVKGPDGNLWFTLASPGGRVVKITTSGTLTYHKLSKGMANGRGIAAGPDGNIWFAATEGNVGKITTSGTFTPYAIAESGQPTGIASGPDGNLWFTENGGNKISKITTSGSVTKYSLPASKSPYGITSGPDEKLWFAANGKVGKITTGGTITEYSLPTGGAVLGVTEGADGNLWFAHYGADKIGKITTGGTITEYSLPAGSKPWNVAAGPDGHVWFTASGSNRIGMVDP